MVTALLRGQNSSSLEQAYAYEELKRDISTALADGGIPSGMIYNLTMVFADLLIKGIVLGHVERGSSIILYLKCGTIAILLNLKEMILSGLLLRLLSDVIKQFIRCQPRIQLVVKEEDYNLTLTYLNIVAGNALV